jgi:hypothetical protein
MRSTVRSRAAFHLCPELGGPPPKFQRPESHLISEIALRKSQTSGW